MNQQMRSTQQMSSSNVIPGGRFQTSSSVYQSKEYQYEQSYGGYQTQVNTIPSQQGYASQQQHQQHNLQTGFNEFQIPIQKEHNQTTQHQTQSIQTATNLQSRNQSQGIQHNLQNQSQYPTPSNISLQSNQPQGQFQGHVPQSQVNFQNPQVKSGTQVVGSNQGHQQRWQLNTGPGVKQGETAINQQANTKPFQPSFQGGITSVQQTEEPIEWPPKNEGGPNLTTVYPSGFKLKDEAPMDHSAGTQVVPSQPAFKITQPMKMRGDDKWPPRRSGGEDITQDEVREFIKPKKGNRDYSEFFAQNALPNSYSGYRAPPGTQHHGEE